MCSSNSDTLARRYRATPSVVLGKFGRSLKKNIATIMLTSNVLGWSVAARGSRYFISFDFGVFCILPSTWLSKRGTGVSG